MEPLRTDAVVLRRLNYGESDRIVHLLTREAGRLAVFARGARASRKRFGAILEPFTLLHAELTQGRGGMPTLTHADLVRTLPALREDLQALAQASYLAELVEALTQEGEANPALFELVCTALESIGTARADPLELVRLQWGLLLLTGFRPNLVTCNACGGRDLGDPVLCVPDRGGVLCRACASGERGTRVAAPALAAMRGEARSPEPADVRAADALVRQFVDHVVARPLRTRDFLDSL